MTDQSRLIEHAFPLKQASLDSVHEKNVRHGHISTLHLWPARRPLAACRAALIATLLPDPGTPEERQKLCEMIGGKVVEKTERKRMPNGKVVERVKEETKGGILHWKRETENADILEYFRQKIREAYGGRAPKVLDPFAGGGAIPLEAMRLGCEVTAADINPVAWFILKCTLEYPQKLAGQTRPLPDFAVADSEFMSEYFKKAKGYTAAQVTKALKGLGHRENGQGGLPMEYGGEHKELQADLAWHVRAWGRWVLARARKDLAKYYPIYADFEPLKPGEVAYERQPMKLVPLRDDGTADIDAMNADFEEDYLADKRNPRWVAKPTVAYLWARTVQCKNCRATIPLLKTRWLCKKPRKRVLLTMEPNADRTGVVFGVDNNVPQKGGNNAAKREHDRRIGAGTMSRAGAWCPCCRKPAQVIMTMEDIRVAAMDGACGHHLMSVAVEGVRTKEYRPATELEVAVAEEADHLVESELPRLPRVMIGEQFAPASTRSISAQLYGIRIWADLYTRRQVGAIARLGRAIQESYGELQKQQEDGWATAITDYLALGLDRLLCFMCVNACWKPDADSLNWAFARFSISLLWDFAEAQPLGTSAGSFWRCCERIATALDGLIRDSESFGESRVLKMSATDRVGDQKYDLVVTDPPYYQAISYADLSDFSYTWLRGVRPPETPEFEDVLADKTHEAVQHIHKSKNREAERQKYEDQMGLAFGRIRESLAATGRFVCVFAHKDPDAWETLVAAIIKAGFTVTGSWPIQTEMPTRQRAASAASLASSVWLVCKPRPVESRAGWDHGVLAEMRKNIAEQLRDFWDAGIRGPDFVWAATGPALEAYSKHPVVKKANEPGPMTVTEFLTHVRRMVVDYVVGQVLSGNGEDVEQSQADRLDDPTAYYLLHRHDFGMEDAPAGTCILYAVSCGLSDRELADTWDILARTGGKSSATTVDEDDEEADPDAAAEDDSGSGSKLKLKTWAQRSGERMGYEAPGGKPVPLIDRIHRLMHLWRTGDVHKVDEYIDDNGLRRHELFKRLLQSLIELSPAGSDERSLLESLSNHIGAKGAKRKADAQLPYVNE